MVDVVTRVADVTVRAGLETVTTAVVGFVTVRVTVVGGRGSFSGQYTPLDLW